MITATLGLPKSISWRLVILVAAAVLPAFGFAAFVADRLAEGERAGYRLQLLATARALSLAIDRDIAAQQATVRVLAGSRELAGGDLAAFYERAKGSLDGDTSRRIVLLDATGQQLVNTFVPYGHELPRSNYRWAIDRVFATGQPQVSNLIIGAVTGRAAVGAYVPVLRDDKVVHALVMGFDVNRLSRILNDQRMPEGWVASIADRDGVILARNRSEHLIGERVSVEAWKRLGTMTEGVENPTTMDGVPGQGAFARSPVTSWTIMVAVETAILEAPLNRSLWWLAGGGALLLLAASGASILYGRRIAAPILELTRMAAALARGEPLNPHPLALPEAQLVADQMRLTGQMLEYRNRERENLLATLEQRVAYRTQELSESEARYRVLADNASDIILRADRESVWRYASPSCRMVLGFEPEELIGQAADALVHPQDKEALFASLRELRPGAEQHTSSFRMRRKDGVYFWAEASITLLVDPVSGKRASYIAVVRNVTRRVEAEEEARRAAARAEAANRAKSNFLASMSHELRTPLSVVIGFAELLLNSRKEPPTPQQREFLDNIQQAGQQLLELINDVLDLAKIESGRLSVSSESVNLKEVTDTFAALIRPMADEKDIGIEIRPWRLRATAVRADRARLLQVLFNLGSNAIKYNRPGGMVIVEVGRGTSGRVRITIGDTGIGIPADRQAHVFERFNRLGAEASGIEGTGIGLAICKRLVDRMHGRIGFTSDPEWGSRFWVEFPEDRAAPMLVAGKDAAASPDLPPCTLLHIDDNPAALALVSQLARSVPNVRTLSAMTGERGVALAIAYRPDVIITDIRLPDISGYEVLDRLRSAPETKGIPVLALSAEAMASDVARGHDAGFAHYMTKPFALDQLLAAMRRAMEQRAA